MLCRPVSVRPPVTFVYSVETSKHSFKIFSLSGRYTILVFLHTKRFGNNPMGMALNAGGVGKKRDFGRISGFAAYRFTLLSTVRIAKCENKAATNSGERRAHRGVRHPLFALDDDEVFVTGSTLYTRDEVKPPPDTTPLVKTPVFCCRRTS